MSFHTRIKVRFGDADPAGWAYYPVIFHYFHVAMEEFFEACCGISYQRMLAEERLGLPTVKVQAEFFSPLAYGDEVDIEVRVSRVGRSSVTLDYGARRAGDEQLCARSSQVHVAIDMNTRRPVPLPEKYRRALEREKEDRD